MRKGDAPVKLTSVAKCIPRTISLLGLSCLAVGCGGTSASRADNRGPVAAPAITIRITLPHANVTSGTPIKGEALLTNTTGKAITVESCAADGWLDVGLENKQIRYEPVTPAVACPPSVQLLPGTNREPITVSTTYKECLQPGGRSKTYVPSCTPTGEPPLPAGTYQIKVVTYGLPHSTPKPPSIEVVLTPA
jgi:hypothetical protein